MMITIPIIPFATALFVLVGMLVSANYSYDKWVDSTVALGCSLVSLFATYGLLFVLGWL